MLRLFFFNLPEIQMQNYIHFLLPFEQRILILKGNFFKSNYCVFLGTLFVALIIFECLT